MTKMLITGATGFIGSTLLSDIQFQKLDLCILLRPRSQLLVGIDNSSQIVEGDLFDSEKLLKACENVEIIIHLAGTAHVNSRDLNQLHKVIVDGTQNLLDAAVKKEAKRFVYISSSLACTDETDPGEITSYGKFKREAEELLLDAHRQNKIEVVILRPVNVYGVGMKGNIATMISLIHRNRLPPLPKLNPVHPQNPAHLLNLEHPELQ